MRIFLFGLFAGMLALVSPLTVSAADTVLVIGDSVAQGVSTAMKPAPTQTIAHQGDSARTIASKNVSGTFTHMVISAGSNLNPPATEADLRAIRSKQPNAKAVWILPYNSQGKAVVSKVAASFGDATVDLSNFPMAQDGYKAHPQSYSAVATAVKTALGTTGTPAQGTPAGEQPAAGGGGTGGPNYNGVPVGTVDAGLVVCGLNGDDDTTANIDESLPCTACHVLLMADVIIDWIMQVMTVIGIAVIFAMGILYIVSAGNEKMIGMAKGGIKAALIGVTVILSAWLIVSTIIRLAGASDYFGSYFQDGVFSFTCDTASNAGTASSTNFGAGGGSSAGGGGSTGAPLEGVGKVPASGGQCSPIQNAGNPCSVENIKKNPCWAALGDTVVQQASGICNAESQGIPKIRSGASATDHCGCATCPVVSQGLFQVNMTAHYDKIGCPKLASPGLNNVQKHTDGWYDASCKLIVSDAVVNTCAQKTIDPAWNINYACQLYKQRGWKPWNYSYTKKCNSFR